MSNKQSNNKKDINFLINLPDSSYISPWTTCPFMAISLVRLREKNYKTYLNSESFAFDKDLDSFINLDINWKDYNYSRFDEKFEYIQSRAWKSDLNIAYTRSDKVKNILEGEIFNTYQNNIDLLAKTAWNKSLVIFIPANTYIKEPISLNDITKNIVKDNQLIIKKVIIIIESNSYVEFHEDNSFNNVCLIQSTTIVVKPNSRVKFIKKHENTVGYSLNNFNCYVYKDSSLSFLEYNYKSNFYLNNLNFILEDSSAEAYYNNLSDIQNNNTQVIVTHQVHKAPNTISSVKIKSTLKNHANSFYKGLIVVDKQANNSSSEQKHLALILDNTVKSVSIPALEVNNNNVKCTHGSAIGKINKDQLWYLISRGLKIELAKKLIIEGFFKEDIKEYNTSNIHKDYVNNLIQ